MLIFNPLVQTMAFRALLTL